MEAAARPAIASSAALFADPARAEMLLALADSGPCAVTDLAAAARVTIPTATAHLARLTRGGVVTSQRAGRLHLYRLSGPEVTGALEVSPRFGGDASISGRRTGPATRPREDHLARTCYDHLAGRLGVGLTDALLQQRLISKRTWTHRPTRTGGYGVTKRGVEFFRGFGVNLGALRTLSRAFAHPCLDRTERRPHMGGALGASIALRLEDLGWIERLPRTRVVRVTPAGRTALRSRFGIEL